MLGSLVIDLNCNWNKVITLRCAVLYCRLRQRWDPRYKKDSSSPFVTHSQKKIKMADMSEQQTISISLG